MHTCPAALPRATKRGPQQIPWRTRRIPSKSYSRSLYRPLSSILRANPFPEVTDPSCRLPLPTLFYWLEAVHLGDLMRLWVRIDEIIDLYPSDFQGPNTSAPITTLQKPKVLLQYSNPLSVQYVSRVFIAVKKKRELFWGLVLTSLSSFTLPFCILKILVQEF